MNIKNNSEWVLNLMITFILISHDQFIFMTLNISAQCISQAEIKKTNRLNAIN